MELDEQGNVIIPNVAEPPEPPEEEVEVIEEPVENKDDREDLSYLTKLSDGDKNHLFGTDGTVDIEENEDDLSDLVDVPNESIMGEKPKLKKKYRIVPRKRYIQKTPTTFRGVQY